MAYEGRRETRKPYSPELVTYFLTLRVLGYLRVLRLLLPLSDISGIFLLTPPVGFIFLVLDHGIFLNVSWNLEPNPLAADMIPCAADTDPDRMPCAAEIDPDRMPCAAEIDPDRMPCAADIDPDTIAPGAAMNPCFIAPGALLNIFFVAWSFTFRAATAAASF